MVSAEDKQLEIRLNFTDPIWVSDGMIPCLVDLYFEDGKAFVSAGFDKPLARDTKKRVELGLQLPKDSFLSKDVVTDAEVTVKGIMIGMAIATPFISIALSYMVHMTNGL